MRWDITNNYEVNKNHTRWNILDIEGEILGHA